MLRFIAVAAFALVLSGPPAQAAIDAAGAERLKEIFTKYIADRKAAGQAAQQELRTEGPLTVEPTKTYYAVTLPHLSVYRPDGGFTDIGIVAINASPADQPNEWKMSVALPSPITSYDAAKKPDRRITLGTQNFNGVWNEALETFSRVDARYQNIVIDDRGGGVKTALPKSEIAYTLTPDAGGKTWSGPIRYQMQGLSIVPPPLGLSEAIPTTATVDAIIEKLPANALKDQTLNIAKTSAPAGAAQKAAGTPIAALFRTLLGNAGTAVKINPSIFSNATYNVAMTGELHANAGTALGADGKIHLDISGLEKLLKLAQDRLQDPQLTPAARTGLQKAVATMMVLQMTGQQTANAQGQPLRAYDIVLTPQGQILLNGADLSMLQMMMGAGAGRKTPTP